MPAISSRSGSKRRSMNEINMVPFIDVMLVLLIIFMVTAPMLAPSSVDVPLVGSGTPVVKIYAQVLIRQDGDMYFKIDGQQRPMAAAELGRTASDWLKTQPAQTPILISAEKTVSYDRVMQAMSALKSAGVPRVALEVKVDN